MRFHTISVESPLHDFWLSISETDVIDGLRAGVIGDGAVICGPFGEKRLVYADYVASGRALRQVEEFVLSKVLPYYANSHTEASYCGGFMTRLRRDARAAIGTCCNCGPEHAVIFAGSGATAGINRLVVLLGVADAVRNGKGARVIIGPYEHHSNILPWRESGAEVIEIAEASDGGPDLEHLRTVLASDDERPTVCAFSAASNVTGIIADVAGITKLVKQSGSRIVWDYAGAGPYLPIDMQLGMDAIVVSPHKFVGGPAASGVLIVRRDAVVTDKPTWPGGGTVSFVSPWDHIYSSSLEAREEAGTPNVIGDIRAGLAFLVKAAIGEDHMCSRNDALAARAISRLSAHDRIELLGRHDARRLPIISIRVKNGKGGYIHHQLVTRMLSDRFGIQARGGCACAGPYVHRLLGIEQPRSEEILGALGAGRELEKPGFVRLNFSVLLTDEKVEYILSSLEQLANDASEFVEHYQADPARAIFSPKQAMEPAFV